MESCRSSTTPVVGFIDVDSFECQLWQKEFPQTRNKPCVVANESKRIVSVTHEAKKLGINRGSTPYVQDANAKCPELIVFTKEVRYGKPENRRTKKGTHELYSAISQFFKVNQLNEVVIELASSDEVYIDLTIVVSELIENKIKDSQPHKIEAIEIPEKVIFEDTQSFVGPWMYTLKRGKFRENHTSYYEHEKERLLLGGQILYRLCEHIKKQTDLVCSGGVSSNKLLSKLSCGLNKPNKITVLYERALPRVAKSIKISSIPRLGSKTGASLCEHFKISTMAELREISFNDLCQFFNNQSTRDKSREDEFGVPDLPINGKNVHSWALGNDERPVISKYLRDSMRLNKPNKPITRYESLKEVLKDLCDELNENLEEEENKNRRIGSSIKFSINFETRRNVKSVSNLFKLKESIRSRDDLFKLVLQKLVLDVDEIDFTKDDWRVTELSVFVKEFIPINNRTGSIINLKNPTMNIIVKNPRNLRIENRVYLGSFFTQDDSFTSLNLIKNPPTSNGPIIPKLLPWRKLQNLIGIDLKEGYLDYFKPIEDRLGYSKLLHECFLTWLHSSGFVSRLKAGSKKPHFISFNKALSEPMRSPVVEQHGDWDIYGINMGGVIYLWDEKTPYWINSESYIGLNFEYYATQSSGSYTVEFNKSYVVSEWSLGEHRCLSVSKLDGIDDSNEWVELVCWKNNENPSIKLQKLKKMWSQGTIGGVNKFIIGSRSQDGKLIAIEQKVQLLNATFYIPLFTIIRMTMAEIEDELEKIVLECYDFENRLLDFIKLNLSEKDENVVKKFSFVCGSKNVICSDIPKSNHERLFVPSIYKKSLA